MRFLATIVLCFGVLASQEAHAQERHLPPTIAVASSSDFIVGEDRDRRARDGLPAELSAEIREALASDGRYRLVEREAFRRVMDEQGFSEERGSDRFAQSVDAAISALDNMEDMSLGSAVTFGVVAGAAREADVLETLADRGSALGADYLLIGSFDAETRTEATAVPGSDRHIARQAADGRLRLRLIDVENATLVAADSIEARVTTTSNSGGALSDALLEALARGASRFVDDALYPATLVSLNPVLVNRGAQAGWQVGDRVEVLSRSSPVRDRGVEMGFYLEPVATAEVVDVQPEISRLRLDGPISEGQPYEIRRSVPAESNAGPQLGGEGASSGYRIAVGEVEWQAPGERRVALVQDILETALADLGRFELVDRRRIDRTLDELEFQSFLNGGSLDQEMSDLTGADYILLGRIDQFEIARESVYIRAVGRSEERVTGRAKATFQIISTQTGTVTAIERIDLSLPGISGSEQLAEALARQSASALLSAILPFEIVGRSPAGEIYVNRGDNWGLEAGERFEVVQLGDRMVGSDGYDYGPTEMPTGVIEIVAVEPERARGRVVEGSAVPGARLRTLAESEAETRPTRAVIDW